LRVAAVLLLSVCLTASAGAAPSGRPRLWDIAARALEQNRVEVGGRRLLAAGRNQFGSMWTRDFAFASRGLLALGDHRTVRDHLDAVLAHVEDGLVPRALDTIPVWRRVTLGMLRGRLRLGRADARRDGPLRAQVRDEHGSPSMDSNLLVVLTALDYVAASGDRAWWQAKRAQIRGLMRYYDAHRDEDGLLVQARYSDWQDSVKREGKSFYLNLLYLTAARRLGADAGLDRGALDALAARLHDTFFDARSGLYRSLAGRRQLSLDGNLLALDLGFVRPESEAGRALYAALRRSGLWTRGGVPGSNTIGDYPKAWLHLPARLAGLRHYHDRLHWSWLTALAGKTAATMGDHAEAARIFEHLERAAVRDGTVAEVYAARRGEMRPFRSLIYRSEAPFSWGAGLVLDALAPTGAR
jgi:glycogen debranching enzyme